MNNIFDRYRWREQFIAATSIGIGIITVYSFIVPTAGNHPVSSFTFPDRLPLNSWQQIVRQSLSKTSSSNETNTESIKAATSYHYRQKDRDLLIETRYIVGTRGDVKDYITQYTNITSKDLAKKKITQIENVGYHYLFTTGDRAYLSSCISPRSQSNVTHKQFSQNRYQHDLNPQVWWNWLLGKASIRDRRCLWTHLSIDSNATNLQTAYKTLEAAWIDWYRWWQPRFPSL